MNKNLCIQKVKNYIVNNEWNISLEDFDINGLVIKENKLEHAIKIIGIDNATIVSASSDLLPTIKEEFEEKNRDMIFECPLSYGQSIFYIPDFNQTKNIDTRDFVCKIFTSKDEIKKFNIPDAFVNSIDFDENGECISKIINLAFDNDKVVGCSGAIEIYDEIWEVGVDVLPEYRKHGLATMLSTNIRIKIQEMGIVPVWRSSITNIGSQIVAQRSGFFPYYISSFGTMGDEFYPYKKLLNITQTYKEYSDSLKRI